MRLWLAFCLALLCLVVTSGCKHDASVVGKWTGKLGDLAMNVEFKDDKSLTADAKLATFGVSFTGTYEIDKKSLTLNLKDYKLKGIDSQAEPMAKKVLDLYSGKSFKSTYHFNDEDDLAVTFNGKTDVWKRVKEDAS